MRAAIMAAAFQNVEESLDIRFRIGVRMIERVANTGLRGEVDHLCEAMPLEQRFRRGAVREIELLESEFRLVLQKTEARLLQGRIIIVVDAIDADHGAALRQQAPCDVKADE